MTHTHRIRIAAAALTAACVLPAVAAAQTTLPRVSYSAIVAPRGYSTVGAPRGWGYRFPTPEPRAMPLSWSKVFTPRLYGLADPRFTPRIFGPATPRSWPRDFGLAAPRARLR